MHLKGKVSSIEQAGVRVAFPDREFSVSQPLQKAAHVGTLEAGDNVVVLFFSNSLADGIIIAKY